MSREWIIVNRIIRCQHIKNGRKCGRTVAEWNEVSQTVEWYLNWKGALEAKGHSMTDEDVVYGEVSEEGYCRGCNVLHSIKLRDRSFALDRIRKNMSQTVREAEPAAQVNDGMVSLSDIWS